MSLFQTLIPALNRPLARRENDTAARAVPTVKPAYEIKETAEAYNLTVDLPGVTKDGVELTVEDGVFRLVGHRAWNQPEGWTTLYRESAGATYELVLTHDNALDPDKVSAELIDGVLRVSLPKHEALKPRKIAVS